jgi:myo-inositol-1(or 4)-monophosphatase
MPNLKKMKRGAKKGDELRAWLDLAKRAARKAGIIQAEHLGHLSGYKLKATANIVTEVDLLCEQAVIGLLREEAPEHNILSEEQGGDALSSEYIWVIDPLDGTTNYTHTYVKFCTSIALVNRGKPIVGVIFDQMANEMFYAVRGQGAFLNGKPIQVSSVPKLNEALLVTGFSYDRGKRLCDNIEIFQKVLPHPHSIRVDGSAALDLCYVASGRMDGFWERNMSPWDVAAGSLLVEEAGGLVTDLKNQPMPLDKKELFASNGRIHSEFLAIINREKEGCHES